MRRLVLIARLALWSVLGWEFVGCICYIKERCLDNESLQRRSARS